MIGYMWIRASCDINKLLIFLIAGQFFNVDSLRAGGQTVSPATPLVEESDAN
jgi:hypothetical protein